MNITLKALARFSEPGYLTRVWNDTNSNWATPPEEELRAFLAALGREVS